jgi:hypothetical protein
MPKVKRQRVKVVSYFESVDRKRACAISANGGTRTYACQGRESAARPSPSLR